MPDPRSTFYDGSDTPFRTDERSDTGADYLPAGTVRCTDCGTTRAPSVIDCAVCDVPRGHIHGKRNETR